MTRYYHCRFLLFVVTATVLIGGCGSDEVSDNDEQIPEEPPEVEILAAPLSLTHETGARFEFECLDERSCEFTCRLNDGEAEPCHSPVEYEGLDNGAHDFEVVAVDEFELESEPAGWQWIIDTEAPQIIDFVGPPEYTNEQEATFGFACSKEDCTFECSFDDEDFQACESPITYTDLEDGTHRFSVRPTDGIGNVGPTETHEWTVDEDSPLVIGLDGPAERTNATTATFDFECSREDCTFECQLGDSEMQSCTPGISYENLEDGAHTFVAVAIDEYGNVGPPAEWTWTVDTVDPVVEVLSGPDDPTNETTATLEFECSKEDCQYRCELSGASQGTVESPTDCDSGHTYSGLAADEYTFSVTATDEAGNTGAAASWEWTVDPVAPVVEELSGPDDPTNETTATLDFECSKEDCQYRCELSGASQGAVESPTDCDSGHTYTDLVDDEYTFSVTATDAAGNTSASASWNWIVDTVEPVVEALSGPVDLTSETTATLEFECSKEDCHYSCELSGASQGAVESPTDCDSGHIYTDLADDEYTFSVIATDEAGNTSAPASWSWTVDTVNPFDPIIEILDAPPMETSGDWAAFEFDCVNKSSCSFECALDHDDGSGSPQTGSWEDCSSPHLVDELEPGEYTMHIRATDEAGNQGFKSVDWRVVEIKWTAISVGGEHSCGVRDDGTLWCWGRGSHSRLGLGDESDRKSPTQVGHDADWESISSGAFHTCGVREDGTLWCWGRGSDGRLGVGDQSNRTTPVQVGDDMDWESVSSGAFHSCGVREDGTLWCWGRGSDGRLGLGDESSRDKPEQVGDDTDWESVSSGSSHTCGVRDDGTLWCWGSGDDGRLGMGDEWDRHTPEQVGDDTDWESVSSGHWHSCGVREDGTLWCWGDGESGQLGRGDESGRDTPGQVGDDADWESISAGLWHTCGVREDGTLWCWGAGTFGRLGLGDGSDRDTPEQVGDDTDWQNVVAASSHSCGVRDDGTLWCWGRNSNGELGLGDESNRDTPAQVGDEADWQNVSAGSSHTCGVREEGTLWCWGSGLFGRLGLGDELSRDTPQQVGDDTDWRSVAAGGEHTQGIRASGAGWSWGSNDWEQLGDGSRAKYEPHAVSGP